MRPKVGGRSYARVNARLRALALDPALSGRLLIADWAAAVRGHRKAWLAKDKVHAHDRGLSGARAALRGRAEQLHGVAQLAAIETRARRPRSSISRSVTCCRSFHVTSGLFLANLRKFQNWIV